MKRHKFYTLGRSREVWSQRFCQFLQHQQIHREKSLHFLVEKPCKPPKKQSNLSCFYWFNQLIAISSKQCPSNPTEIHQPTTENSFEEGLCNQRFLLLSFCHESSYITQSLATRLRFLKEILPVSSSSKRRKA